MGILLRAAWGGQTPSFEESGQANVADSENRISSWYSFFVFPAHLSHALSVVQMQRLKFIPLLLSLSAENEKLRQKVKILEVDGSSGAQQLEQQLGGLQQTLEESCEEQIALIRGKHVRVLETERLKNKKTLAQAEQKYKPSAISNYLVRVCQSFNEFYQNNKIIGGEEDKLQSRLLLIESTSKVISEGLNLLGIETLEEM